VAPKPVTVLPAGAPPPACSLANGAQSFDGLDDWGAARPATLGSAAGMHPLMGGPPVVTGTPVQFSMEELSAFDDQCDECPDDEDADGILDLGPPLRTDSPAHHIGSSTPAPAPPDMPLPVPRWWVVRSPDGQYMDARSLTHDEWADLHHADFGLHYHGDGTAGEIRARAALATLVAQIGAEQRTAWAEQHAAAPVHARAPPGFVIAGDSFELQRPVEMQRSVAAQPAVSDPPTEAAAVAAAATGEDARACAGSPGPGVATAAAAVSGSLTPPPGPASPPGAIVPRRSHQSARTIIDALRPDIDSPVSIRAALQASGLRREVCSPRIGGGGNGTRTKLTVINEARALFVLPPLIDVDPASVARHQAQYLARQAPMGAAVPLSAAAPPPATSSAASSPEMSADEDEASPPTTDDEGEGGAPPQSAVSDGAVVSDAVTDVSGITVGAILFEWPSRDSLMACGMMALLLLLTVGVIYVAGAPPPVLAAAGSGLVTSSGPMTSLARAFARAGAGAGLMAQATLAASQGAPVQLFAGATSVALVVHRFFEAEGWRVLLFAVRLAAALSAAAARRAYRVMRASPGLAVACGTGTARALSFSL
jgi:hypothetical protein